MSRTSLAYSALFSAFVTLALSLYAKKLDKQSWIREAARVESLARIERDTYAFPLSRKTLARQTDVPAYSLFENHTPLTECQLSSGQALDAGSFYVASSKVYFVTIDSSDPRTNGNVYTLRYRGIREKAALSVLRKIISIGICISIVLALGAMIAYRQFLIDSSILIARFLFKFVLEFLKSLAESVRTSDPIIPIFFLIPVVFALFSNQNMYFDGPGCLDSYIYTAYFTHYPRHLEFLEIYYKSSRLPWILPGYLAYSVAGPIAGSYLLHMTVHAAGGVFCYLAIRDSLHHRRIAALVAIFYSCCTALFGPGGWNYHANITLLYYSASIWCLTKARQAAGSAKAWHIWSGVFIACSIHTHLAMVGLLPMQVLHFLASSREKARNFAWQAMFIFLGGVFITALLSMINYSTGGTFWFFLSQIDYTMWLSRMGNHWYEPVDAWIRGAYWLVPMAIAGVCSVLLVLKAQFSSQEEQQKRMLLSCAACNLCCLVYLEYLQVWKHHNVLQSDFMTIVVYFHVFHAIAAFLVAFDTKAPIWTEPKTQERMRVLIMAGLVMAPLLLSSDGMRDRIIHACPQVTQRVSGALQVSFALGVVAILAGAMQAATRWKLWLVVLFWSASNLLCKPVNDCNALNRNAYYRDMYACFRITEDECAEFSPTLVEVKFWLDPNEVWELDGQIVPLGRAFDSMVATRGWLGNLLGTSPGLPISEIEEEHFSQQKYLAILSSIGSRQARVDEFMARLNAIGWSCEPVKIRDIRHGRFEYALVVFEVHKCME